jgi:hypothetical protein
VKLVWTIRDTADGRLDVVVMIWFEAVRDIFRVLHSARIFDFEDDVVFRGRARRDVCLADHQVMLVHASKLMHLALLRARMVLARQRGVIVAPLFKSCTAEFRGHR